MVLSDHYTVTYSDSRVLQSVLLNTLNILLKTYLSLMGQEFEFYCDNSAINILAFALALSPSLSLNISWLGGQNNFKRIIFPSFFLNVQKMYRILHTCTV